MTERGSLTGKTVLVVGGTRNLGLDIARRADADGAHVVIAGRDRARADTVAATLSHARGLRLDVTSEDDVSSAAVELGAVEHIVVTAAAHHNVAAADLEHDKVLRAFDPEGPGSAELRKRLQDNGGHY